MDLLKERAKLAICKCFMNMLTNGVQTEAILLFLNQ